jgi:hypothetical protein
MNYNYTIVTICNRIPSESYYCLREWEKSTDDTNKIVIQHIDTPYQGLGDKPKFVYRAIKRGIIPTKYIIFCDCWDVVFVDSPERIIEKHQDFKCDLVFSSERNCFPADLKEDYDKLPFTSSYKYLNSGFIVGETEALLTTLEAMKVEEIPDDYWDAEKQQNVHFNDQFEYQKIFLQQPVSMKLDYAQELSQTMHNVKAEDIDLTGERIRNVETNSFPSSIHFNGEGKTAGLQEPILKKLGLR